LAHNALGLTRPRPNYVGIICTKTHVGEVCQQAIDNAVRICNAHYGLIGGPPVLIHGQSDIEFMYVPSHLHHMVFELVKNSLRAVVERYGEEADVYPEIKVIIAEGREDITIKISDEGGGIPRSGMPLIWTYMYTTAEHPNLEEAMSNDFRAPLAGFGYGLPLSRLYARYFGGDLRLTSMEGMV
jgi:pyruvate dehydrogenase kinase 2/3/4